jgi:uncharacterized protein (DUF697 family)/tellurite resistance protein
MMKQTLTLAEQCGRVPEVSIHGNGLAAHDVSDGNLKEYDPMDEQAYEAIATVGLMAAFADGQKDEAEREKLKEIFETFGASGPTLYRRVLMKETDLAREAGRLTTPEARNLAFEMAVAVCDADGSTSPAEHAFLQDLRRALDLPEQAATDLERQANQLAEAPIAAAPASLDTPPAPVPGAPQADPVATQLDQMILKYAILNGALELMPQSLATMAILPMQMKMVYRIGKQYGIELDSGHVKEFLAVAGLGITSQAFENVARKFLGNFARKTLGKSVGRLAKGAVGPAMTFATTYAIGQVAKSYYGGGRQLRTDEIKALFQKQVGQAQQLYTQHAGAVQSQAQSLDMGTVMNMARGTV